MLYSTATNKYLGGPLGLSTHIIQCVETFMDVESRVYFRHVGQEEKIW